MTMPWRRILTRGIAESVALARSGAVPQAGLRILMYHAVGSPAVGDSLGIYNISPKLFAQQAAALADIAIGFRKSRLSPSKVMSALAADCAGVLMDDNSADLLRAAAARAKAAANASIDEQLERALALSKIPRGTTGTGGINRDDVVVEVFTTDKKSSAVARNTSALRAAGRIS